MRRRGFLSGAAASIVLPGANATAKTDDGLYEVTHYDPARDPAADLPAAVSRATAENKRILLELGGGIWCEILDRFLERDTTVREAFRQSFVIVKVSVSPENRNEVFLAPYPAVDGYPFFIVLESDGRFLGVQETAALEEGLCYNRTSMLAFAERWRKR
jgi:hypothetical protein